MIPKIIHYCWFGKKAIPNRLQKCINSWKKHLPDYQIIEWNESNYDVSSRKWTKEAYELGKYAFVADYVRLKVLYEYGGIYLDTDVEIKKRLDPFLKNEAFGGFETGKTITTGVIGAHPGNLIIKAFLDFYETASFILPNGEMNNDSNVLLFTSILKEHGLQLNNQYQVIDGFAVYPKTYFCPLDVWHYRDITKNTYAIHYFDGSWLDEETKLRIKKESKAWYKMYIETKGVIGKLYHFIKRDRV